MALFSMILAAGEGKRMKSNHAKPLMRAAGKTLIEWVLDAVSSAGTDENIVVIGHCADEMKEFLGKRVTYAYQYEQLGTGHAVMQGIDSIANQKGTVMVLCGDTPLITEETLKMALALHEREQWAATVITAHADNPFGYGRIVRENGKVARIVEQKDANEMEQSIQEINSGMYLFDIQRLYSALGRLTNKNAQKEYYLTDVIGILIEEGYGVGSYLADMEETLGVNDRIQLEQADHLLRARKVRQLMLDGVCVLQPETVRVDAQVKIGMDTTLYPGTILEGDTKIGMGCNIGPNTRIVNCMIEDGAEVQYSVAEDCVIEKDAKIGPFLHMQGQK